MTFRIDHTVTSGTFSLDGETFDVDNNVWIVGDDNDALIIDAPHDADAIIDLVGHRDVVGIFCTHGHDDHVKYAPEIARRCQAKILLHPDCEPLWLQTHADEKWDIDLEDGQRINVAGQTGIVLHTPGHAPGAVCLYFEDAGVVFSGDTLFEGGPGATGRSYSDKDTIVRSITEKLFALPDDTTVHTGHGPSTTIGAEKKNISHDESN